MAGAGQGSLLMSGEALRGVNPGVIAGAAAWSLAGLILFQLVANAWLSDDYFVGIRQVLNLLAGNEFSYNAGERVQTMTSPLWGLLMIAVVQAGGLFYGPIVFSLFLSMVAVALIARRAHQVERAGGAVLALGFLFLSRSFTDYASGGLEGPLAFALIAICVFSGLRLAKEWGASDADFRRNFLVFSIGAALLFLTRYDYAVLAGPAVLLVAASGLQRAGLRVLVWSAPAVGLVVGWLVFSTVYFGSPFSNTAFSKLATGLEGSMKHQHSLVYFLASFRFDAVGFGLMAAAAAFALLTPRWHSAAWMAGVAAYVGYVYSFGGDFMAGRFFAAPVVASACVLAVAFPKLSRIREWLGELRDGPSLRPMAIAGLALCTLVGAGVAAQAGRALIIGSPPMRTLDLVAHPHRGLEPLDMSGGHLILDEKHFYLGRGQGLFAEGSLAYRRELEAVRRDKWSGPDARLREWAGVVYVNCGMAGEIGFAAGPGVYVFDSCGLADPFVSKLPMLVPYSGGQEADYRPGHYIRAEPPGYAASFSALPEVEERPHSLEAAAVERQNRLEDPDLAYLYDEVRLVVSGPMFTADRWRAIWDLHFGDTLELARGAEYYMAERAPELALAQ